jgi:hypothetical protein
MALVTTMPSSISRPMSVDRSSVWPVAAKETKAPMMASASAKRIKHFVNPNAGFLYVPADQVMAVAERGRHPLRCAVNSSRSDALQALDIGLSG